jgi:four helix bundle protein
MALAKRAYRLTAKLPKYELYGMTSQMRRAAVSIAANIAEGYGRDNKGFFVQSLRVAQGSLKELETHLMLAARVGLVAAEEVRPMLEQCNELGRMLRALIRSIQGRRTND